MIFVLLLTNVSAPQVWLENGLELYSVEKVKCEFCQRPMRHDVLAARHHMVCDGSRCDEFTAELTAAA